MFGVFQLSNRGLSPLGQTETGLMVPLVGAREATFFGGLLVAAVTLVTARKVPGLSGFQLEDHGIQKQGDLPLKDRAGIVQPSG